MEPQTQGYSLSQDVQLSEGNEKEETGLVRGTHKEKLQFGVRTSEESHTENDLRGLVNSNFSARYSSMKVKKANFWL